MMTSVYPLANQTPKSNLFHANDTVPLSHLFQHYKISGRGRGSRGIPLEETNPDSNASITQILRMLVEQTGRGNGQSSSSRGPSNDDPQEKFRRQKPKEFSGTTDPLVAESWIKSMKVIFEYLQMPDLDRPRCAIYMLRDDAMIWWEGAKMVPLEELMNTDAVNTRSLSHAPSELLETPTTSRHSC
ncbi:hypothetical protein F511_39086 [Dorcoceras hygrometricum]|uniref:Uncharacterized protein n=1 Tax=Dorcoceras hygrometricum TaxID=472368 RepID=A0A2Z7AP05_9LAMI|nr:hypothetical protein F511_39086 [Dorcoceras hygrometricum]